MARGGGEAAAEGELVRSGQRGGGEQPGYGAACGAAAEHGALRIVGPMK